MPVKLVLDAKNQTDSAFRAVEKNIDGVEKKGGLLKNALATAFGVFTGGALLSGVQAVGRGVTSFLQDSFSGASEAQQAFAGVKQIITSTGGAAGITAQAAAELASSLSAAAGKSLFGDESILAAEQVILRFSNIKDEVFPGVMQAAVDMAQAIGTEPAAAAAILGKALESPEQAAAKLKRAGVVLNEEQQLLIKNMTAAGDVAGAQGVILDALGEKFGGQALASAQTFSGMMTTIKDRIGEAQETIGNAMMPALQSLAAWFASPEAGAAIEAFANVLGTVLGGAITWLTQTAFPWLTNDALPALQGAFTAAWPVIQSAVSTVYAFLSGTVWPWLRDDAWPWLKDTALPALQGAFEAVWPAISAAVSATYTFLKDSVWPWLRDDAWPWLKDTALPALQGAFEAVWPKIQSAVSAVYTFLKDSVWPWLRDTAWPWLKDTALPALQTAFETVWPKIQSAVNAVYTFLKDTVWPWLRDTAWPWLKDTALPALQKAWDDTFGDISTAVGNTYTYLKDTVWPFLKTAFDDAARWIEDMKGRWDTAIGDAKDYVQGLYDKVKTVKEDIEKDVKAIKEVFTVGWAATQTTIKGIWDTIGGYISGPIDAAKKAVDGAITLITKAVSGAVKAIEGLIRLINSIPSVNVDVPSGGGGGGFGGDSVAQALMNAAGAYDQPQWIPDPNQPREAPGQGSYVPFDSHAGMIANIDEFTGETYWTYPEPVTRPSRPSQPTTPSSDGATLIFHIQEATIDAIMREVERRLRDAGYRASNLIATRG